MRSTTKLVETTGHSRCASRLRAIKSIGSSSMTIMRHISRPSTQASAVVGATSRNHLGGVSAQLSDTKIHPTRRIAQEKKCCRPQSHSASSVVVAQSADAAPNKMALIHTSYFTRAQLALPSPTQVISTTALNIGSALRQVVVWTRLSTMRRNMK